MSLAYINNYSCNVYRTGPSVALSLSLSLSLSLLSIFYAEMRCDQGLYQ